MQGRTSRGGSIGLRSGGATSGSWLHTVHAIRQAIGIAWLNYWRPRLWRGLHTCLV